MTTVPILFAFDNKLVQPAGVCLSSLLENAGPDTFYDIFILHDGDTVIDGRILSLPEHYGNCRITERRVENEFSGAYEIRGITSPAYYRFLAPELIPEYDKILYSDVDVIFREDLSPYYLTDIGDNYFGAVDNCSSLRPDVRKYVSEELHLDYRKGFYYSGNIVINSRKILEDGLIESFRAMSMKKYFQQDMDIMNIVCNGRIFPMPPSFCMTTSIYEQIMCRREDMARLYSEEEVMHTLKSGIVHYNGNKPWNAVCPNMDIWWEYYRKSIFFDEQFARDFWYGQSYRVEKMSLWKRIKLVGRYFREGGRK